MEDHAKTVAFTGHRHLEKKELALIAQKLPPLLEKLYNTGYSVFRAGGALGFDTLAAEHVIKLRHLHPCIRLELILPHPAQARTWEEGDQRRYEEILQKADRVKYISSYYYEGVLQERNRALIRGADLCVAYLRTSHGGGAAYTAQFALREGVELMNLYM